MTHEPSRASTGGSPAPVPVSQILRALREARGIGREGWAARLGYSRATVQRWEQGETLPDGTAEAALLAVCEELGLFRQFDSGLLRGITPSSESLAAWLADARLASHAVSMPAVVLPSPPPIAGRPGIYPSRTSLPQPLTDLIGRERELRETLALLHTSRLLTITGPGGTGKTRLALAVAAEAHAGYDATVFVDLAPLSDAAAVAPTIARALGLHEAAERSLVNELGESARGEQLLLVLDNFEHLLAAAPLVHELLVSSPRLTAFVTSRVALHLSGEVEYALAPLPVPDLGNLPPVEQLAHQPAVALFVQRARSLHSTFELSQENERPVAEIVARLDGLPLAIELAAAWVKLLPPQELLHRLGQRLPLLTRGARNLPARQQTLGNTIAWSVELLDPPGNALFRRLASFSGGCTLDAVEAVCLLDDEIDILAGIGSLVDSSLLVQKPGLDGERRMMMLATVQEYAQQLLAASDEAERLARQHARYFLGLAERAIQGRGTAAEQRWLAEHANISAAFAWAAAQGDVELSVRFIATQRWYEIAVPMEWRRWAERVLASPAARPRTLVRGLTLYFAGYMAWSQGDIRTQNERLAESVAIWRELNYPPQLTVAASFQALGLAVRDECLAARQTADEAVVTARGADDAWITTVALYNQGRVHATCGDDRAALRIYEEALTAARPAHDAFIVACVRTAAAVATCRLGDLASAVLLFKQFLPVMRTYGDTRHIALIPANLGYAAAQEGDLLQARRYFVGSLQYGLDQGDLLNTASCVAGLGVCRGLEGEFQQAARLFGAAYALLIGAGARRWPGDRLDHIPWVAVVRNALDDPAFQQAWEQGNALTQDQAVALARTASS